ncbi:MAG: hypothetical protein J7M25_01315 [Deltaproteobacteria bacterium]|nr:hypothetical protein [Deltaproteobacteria bacterium]
MQYDPKELAYGGLFGAAALTLPIVFHAVHLGHVFMPMYFPLMTLPFLVGPKIAATTALVIPIFSGLVTGMPPFYPPIALFMSAELTMMAAVASWWYHRRETKVIVVLVSVLLLGRVMSAVTGYLLGLVLDLPAKFTSVMSVVSGWPGVVLMVVGIPPLLRLMSEGRTGEPD